MSTKAGELRFREGLDRLEGVVRALEGDDLELEEALDRYQEGLSLYRQLCDILNRAEERVEALSGEKAGKLLWKKFQGAADGGEGERRQEPQEPTDDRLS